MISETVPSDCGIRRVPRALEGVGAASGFHNSAVGSLEGQTRLKCPSDTPGHSKGPGQSRGLTTRRLLPSPQVRALGLNVGGRQEYSPELSKGLQGKKTAGFEPLV